MSRPRRRLPRPLAISLSLLLGLALCEALLHAGGWVYLGTSGRAEGAETALGPEGLTLLCLGDSNTFGVYEKAGDTYPARLQRLLDEHTPGGPHRVVNLGIPGLNTRQVLDRLPQVVAEYGPDAVLVLAGVNNQWSWQPHSSVSYEERPWYERLHLVKLGRLVASRLEGGPQDGVEASAATEGDEAGMRSSGRDREGRRFEYEGPPLTRNLPPGGLEATLDTDYRAMDGALSEAAVPLVLLTYAWDEGLQSRVNATARSAAAATGRPLVDAAAEFASLIAELGREPLFYPDTHPTAAGYELFARVAFNRLVEEGLVRGERVELLESGSWGRLRLRGEPAPGRPPGLEIVGEEPEQPFVLLLSAAGAGPRGSWRGVETPLLDDDIFHSSLAVEGLRGVTDAAGRAEVALEQAVPEAEWAPLAGRKLRAAYVVLERDGSPRARRVSPALDFSF